MKLGDGARRQVSRVVVWVLTCMLCLPVSSGRAMAGLSGNSAATALALQGAALLGLPVPMADISSGPAEDGRRAAAWALAGLDGPLSGLAGRDVPGVRSLPPWSGARRSGSGLPGQGGDMGRLLLDRGLSRAVGFANATAESLLMGLTDGGRARLAFSVDWHGHVSGEGDVFYPLYDGLQSTLFAQIGARSMDEGSASTRWIGNLGLGQRWFPAARDAADAGEWMLGWNVFFDYDFTRSHSRGGVGVEVQYDWLRLASNYYFPLSGWKDSEDYDGRFVRERAASGWDVRAKGYLPFYRHIAVTGAFSQWFGDRVGLFGPERLERDPRVWSYGLEYTPVPLLTGFVTQRRSESGRTATEAGLHLTYRFSVPLADQLKPSRVAALRTVSGSRHEFVDRENRMVLEYAARNVFRVEYLGMRSQDEFVFRVRNGFGEYAPGQTVRVTVSGAVQTLAEAGPSHLLASAGRVLSGLFAVSRAYAAELAETYVTNGSGEFRVRVKATGPFLLTVQAGESSQAFDLAGQPSPTGPSLSFTSVTGGGDFQNADSTTATLVALFVDGAGDPVSGTEVTWEIMAADNSANLAVTASYRTRATGLAWGAAATASPGVDLTASEHSTTNASGEANMSLTDIVGERTVKVRASVLVDGQTYTAERNVTFGNGPLSRLSAPRSSGGAQTWGDAYALCNGGVPYSGDFSGWSSGDYVGGTSPGLPTRNELQAVTLGTGVGASVAAGWPDGSTWAGEAYGSGYAFYVDLDDGVVFWGLADLSSNVFPATAVCRR